MKYSETHLSTEAISGYVDGELAAGPRERAARHIRTCFECAYAVGVQQQAKDSLICGDLAVPSTLLSRLGQIPFSADLGSGGLDGVGLYADEAGRFQFRVAAPVDPEKSARTGFGHRRGRTFRSSAAAVAVLSMVAGPISTQAGNGAASRGHQIQIGSVISRSVDQAPPHLAHR